MTDDYSTEYIKEIYERNVDDIYGICFSYLKNIHDCEDAVSAVFVKLMKNKPIFQSQKQEKAWLIITACNHCKSILRFSLRHPRLDIAIFRNRVTGIIQKTLNYSKLYCHFPKNTE